MGKWKLERDLYLGHHVSVHGFLTELLEGDIEGKVADLDLGKGEKFVVKDGGAF